MQDARVKYPDIKISSCCLHGLHKIFPAVYTSPRTAASFVSASSPISMRRSLLSTLLVSRTAVLPRHRYTARCILIAARCYCLARCCLVA